MSTTPVVIVCTLFGVSMDYEVFMLSRIAEAYRAGATNRDAVATGLVATGRIITSAAAILVVVGLAFTTADVVIVKELGLGLALAIGLDATLIRSMLVPATMRVLGDWNWWPSGRRRRRASRDSSPRPAHVGAFDGQVRRSATARGCRRCPSPQFAHPRSDAGQPPFDRRRSRGPGRPSAGRSPPPPWPPSSARPCGR